LLKKGDSNARSIYENIINQEKFLKALNDVVKATSREGGGRDKKMVKLRQFLNDTAKSSSFDLVDFNIPISLISDPNYKICGINVDKTTMFKSNLMPCKFVFKTANEPTNTMDASYLPGIREYSVIYKIGDDLRQDQLVLQMIALMDKVKMNFCIFLS
jgi:phosphatidylinositol 3-kinase